MNFTLFYSFIVRNHAKAISGNIKDNFSANYLIKKIACHIF